MANTFFASDHHFHHTKLILGFGEGRTEHENSKTRPFATIEEHDEAIIENHNKDVRPQDTVYFGGDVYLSGGDGKPFDYTYLARMNGKKKLIIGNHDTHKKLKDMEQYFTHIVAYQEIGRDFLFSHVPIHPSQLKTRFKANIHGHVHSDTLDDERYFNVSLENINYTPISLEDIKKHFRELGIIE